MGQGANSGPERQKSPWELAGTQKMSNEGKSLTGPSLGAL